MRTSILTILVAVVAFPAFAKPVNPQKAAAEIDKLVAKGYAEHEIEPNKIADDNTFVRRAYLDIAGRIPTVKETQQFLDSKAKNKRVALVGRLLESPGFNSNEFNFWADVLRITQNIPGQDRSNAQRYATWVKNAIADNMPYDKFVHALVTADGMIDENGAAGFYLRDRGMALDHMAATVQVFLGTQLVCAQCHDHPFDDWTQMDYYKLAAFSSPVTTVRAPDSVNESMGEMRKVISKEMPKDEQRQAQRALGNFTINFRNSVIGESSRELQLPHDYQYDDAKPKSVVKPATPFGEMVYVKDGDVRTDKYAGWMTSLENPLFTKVVANRLWKRAMGSGVFEPVDNVSEDNFGSNPELMKYLIQLMKDVDYDMRAFYKVVYSTKTYQREASAYDPLSGEPYRFQGPVLRRMSAEQMWDSMVTLVRSEPDTAGIERNELKESGRLDAWKRLQRQDSEVLVERQKKLVAQDQEVNEKLDEYEARINKAIKQKNVKAAQKTVVEMREYSKRETAKFAKLTYWDLEKLGNNGYFRTPFRNQPQALVRKLQSAFPKEKFVSIQRYYPPEEEREIARDKKEAREKAEREETEKLVKELGPEAYKRHAAIEKFENGVGRTYVRASEVGYPAPANHFLRVFGQSDRELIENSSREPSVPQSLKLMNGNLNPSITSAYSVLFRDMDGRSFDEQCDHLYTALLSRTPTASERRMLKTAAEGEGKDAMRGVAWALLNTQQFMFIQ